MSLTIDVKVVPSSGRQKLVKDRSGMFKCFLKNPPEKGKANKELIDFFSRILNVPKGDVEIVSGRTSRKKRVCIAADITIQQLNAQFGIEEQLSIAG